jgi:hypothetical protein
VVCHHEAASKFFDQKKFRLKIKQSSGILPDTLDVASLFQPRAASFERAKPMKYLIFSILLVSSPGWAQTKLVAKGVTAHADNCAPIGRTANGTLVYSMKCENLPAPPPPPQAEAPAAAAPAPEPEVHRSGIFGLSYERKSPEQ